MSDSDFGGGSHFKANFQFWQKKKKLKFEKVKELKKMKNY